MTIYHIKVKLSKSTFIWLQSGISSCILVLELAGNLLAELLAEFPTALLAEMFLLLAENSRNFEPFLMFFTQIFKKISSKKNIFTAENMTFNLIFPKS